MSTVCIPFEGKRITVMGLGLLGRGVGDVEFLASCGAHILVTDTKSEAELFESVQKLRHHRNVEFHLGGHHEDDFTACDLVIKAAGVPLDSPYITAARRAGVPVAMSTALFAKYAMEAGATIVGVTGTRGKSTVTHMIYHSLISAFAKASADRRANVFLGGNIRGVSTLAMLNDIKKDDIAVLELDSWQLQGFGDLGISPHVAVFTNLMPDHMNYYLPAGRQAAEGMDAYFEDKANIFRFQHQGDTLMVGNDIEERIPNSVPHVVASSIPEDWQLKIPGVHNRENAALAAGALRALGLSDADIRTGLESFPGVEGRLQFLGEVKGIAVYNDNNATTPEATVAALRALDTGKKNIVLIAGGADKGLDMKDLMQEIQKTCRAIIFLNGTGTNAFLDSLRTTNYELRTLGPFGKLELALQEALEDAQPDDIILFSPAFASFGMFKNEYERNDEFVKLVRART